MSRAMTKRVRGEPGAREPLYPPMEIHDRCPPAARTFRLAALLEAAPRVVWPAPDPHRHGGAARRHKTARKDALQEEENEEEEEEPAVAEERKEKKEQDGSSCREASPAPHEEP